MLFRKRQAVVIAAIFLVVLFGGSVSALRSNSYQIEEDFIGGGGAIDAASNSYRSQDSIGATAVGPSASAHNGTQSGATTTDDPMLEFSVNSSGVALGQLSTSLTRTGTATFSVRNYTSYGYVVQVVGAPPANNGHELAAMTSTASSSAGTEQFGINLMANTNPQTFGAVPVQVPSGDFSYGQAESGYNTANQYRYNSGEIIARAPKSSGQTDYTISYIANISNQTPSGAYTGKQTIICTGTY